MRISKNPDKQFSAFLLCGLSPDDMMAYAEVIDDTLRNSYLRPVFDRIEIVKEKKRISDRVKEGAEAPDFVLKDTEGSDLSLSSLRGRWVVLDFWGSWCVWCIKGFPDMKKYYDRYRNKLEIVGIDCNDTSEKWIATVEKFDLPWINVYAPVVNDGPETDPLVLYNVKGFPTKIIIDPEGRIRKIFSGEDPAFYEELDRLLK